VRAGDKMTDAGLVRVHGN